VVRKKNHEKKRAVERDLPFDLVTDWRAGRVRWIKAHDSVWGV